jgi:hypothetical protein
LAKKSSLALTAKLFNVLLSLLHGIKSNFLDFAGEATPALGDETAKLAESSEMTVQRNSLKECNTQVVGIPQLLRGTSGFQPPKTVQKDYTNEGSCPDLHGVNYARPLKVTKAKRF